MNNPRYSKQRLSGIRKPPFGYDLTDEGNLIPIQEDLEILEEIADLLEFKAISLRNAALWLSEEASRSITHEGLRRRLQRPVYLDD